MTLREGDYQALGWSPGGSCQPCGWLVKGTYPNLQAGRNRPALRNKVVYSKCMRVKVFFNHSRTGGMSSSSVSDLEAKISMRRSDIMSSIRRKSQVFLTQGQSEM